MEISGFIFVIKGLVLKNKKTIFSFLIQAFAFSSFACAETFGSFLGPKVNKDAHWLGNQVVSSSIPILVLAGHADSQKIEGAGTSGQAVDLYGHLPMDKNISDELFWNLKVRDAVVRIGKKQGLKISSYDPVQRTIVDENNYTTNWSKGSRFAAKGGYVLEIHFDSYGENGLGSGLIPPLTHNLNNLDEAFAQAFGRYPLFFRGGLGAPRRQIRILEIGKLEGDLERNLRDINSRDKTIEKIANYIVETMILGLTKTERFNLQLQEGDIFAPSFHH